MFGLNPFNLKACLALGFILGISSYAAWSNLTPFGAGSRLTALTRAHTLTVAEYKECRLQRATAIKRANMWALAYQGQKMRLTKLNALQIEDASKRARLQNKGSYEAGFMAGKVLGKSSAKNSMCSTSPSGDDVNRDSNSSGMRDFRKWFQGFAWTSANS